MFTPEQQLEIKRLINDAVAVRNPLSKVYDRLPGGQDGDPGEIRLSANKTGQFFISAFINKQWRTQEFDMSTAIMQGLINNTDLRTVRVDPSTNSLQTIIDEHHELHAGNFYRAGFQKDIPNSGTSILAITTPNTTKELHFRPAVDMQGEASVMLYENPTSITGGTALTPRNGNRNSASTSVATVVTDPTADLTGAITLGNQVLGSGKSTGGSSGSTYEWILKKNTIYVLIVTNQTTSANEVNIRCSWYEHTPKDS